MKIRFKLYLLQNSSEMMALASSNGEAKAPYPNFARYLLYLSTTLKPILPPHKQK